MFFPVVKQCLQAICSLNACLKGSLIGFLRLTHWFSHSWFTHPLTNPLTHEYSLTRPFSKSTVADFRPEEALCSPLPPSKTTWYPDFRSAMRMLNRCFRRASPGCARRSCLPGFLFRFRRKSARACFCARLLPLLLLLMLPLLLLLLLLWWLRPLLLRLQGRRSASPGQMWTLPCTGTAVPQTRRAAGPTP